MIPHTIRFVREPPTDIDRAYDNIVDAIKWLSPRDAVAVLERTMDAVKRGEKAYRMELGD